MGKEIPFYSSRRGLGMVYVVIFLLFLILIFIVCSGLYENNKYKNSTQSKTKSRKQSRIDEVVEKAKNEDKCAHCVFCEYIDSYYTLNVACQFFGYLKAPNYCARHLDKKEYTIVLRDGKKYIKNHKTNELKYEVHTVSLINRN